MPKHDYDREEGVVTKQQEKVEKPPLYKVLLHNDDYTTMDFVVAVLVTIFNHSLPDALKIMLAVHHEGVGVAGVYPYDVAETKVAKVSDLAREHEYPLLCTLEKE